MRAAVRLVQPAFVRFVLKTRTYAGMELQGKCEINDGTRRRRYSSSKVLNGGGMNRGVRRVRDGLAETGAIGHGILSSHSGV